MTVERRQVHARPAVMWGLIAALTGLNGYTAHDRNLAVHDRNITADEASRMIAMRDRIEGLYDELRKESVDCIRRELDYLERHH